MGNVVNVVESAYYVGRADEEWPAGGVVSRKKRKEGGGSVFIGVISRRENANVITNALKNLWVSLEAQETAATVLDAGRRWRTEIRSESRDLWFWSRPSATTRPRRIRFIYYIRTRSWYAFSLPGPWWIRRRAFSARNVYRRVRYYMIFYCNITFYPRADTPLL